MIKEQNNIFHMIRRKKKLDTLDFKINTLWIKKIRRKQILDYN